MAKPKTEAETPPAVEETATAAPAATPARAGKIALISRTGQDRYRGTYIVPASSILVLDLATVSDVDLGELMGDPHILKVRTDTPVTPKNEVGRFERTE